ncbi:bile acid:sodium symporter family protein [Nocardiopsis ansamitocini]|uniref:Transporter n=1 Tax=Nocardiopsis ansamitocini TaxID=1670832 RepID=A0A9W6P3L8_9ACTN|nr:bile acid:sodium symporter family protein [Nocardiopsis ansamitocini]GLU46462.1 transporter [Nocardiopsis ansamitocini]
MQLLIDVFMPLALAVVMFGLGLSLAVDDFRRVVRYPRAVLVALLCQLLLLPGVCLGLVLLFDLPGPLAVGMMLLAASPGGTAANLYSHLFRGDVALNVTLTAINSVISVITLPFVVNLSLAYFLSDSGSLGLQFDKVVQVFAVVLVPVAAGMAVRARFPSFARGMDRPVKIASIVVLVTVTLGAMLAEAGNLATYFASVGAVAGLFCLISLSVGYLVPRLFRIAPSQATASAMEIGLHNNTIAITVGASLLGDIQLAVPAAVYGVLAFVIAALFGAFLARSRGGERIEAAAQSG